MKKILAVFLIFILVIGGAIFIRMMTVQPFEGKIFPSLERPLNIAHRGGRDLWPENTLHAFEQALVIGTDVLELDVHRTADQQLVVIHDATVNRTSNGTGRVDEMTLAQLRELDFSHNFKSRSANGSLFRDSCLCISTLDEVFHRFPDAFFNIEIKANSVEVAGEAIRLIRQRNLAPQVLLASFHPEISEFLQTHAEDIPLAASRKEIKRLAVLSRLKLGFLHQPIGRVYEVPVQRDGNEIVTPAFIGAAHALGQEVFVWTINDSTEISRLLEMGVDGILTDRPDIASTIIRKRASLLSN